MTIRDLQLPIRTARLTLRPFAAGDFAAYADYQSRDDVYRYLYAQPPVGEALAQQFRKVLEAPFERDGDILRLAVSRNDDGAVLGEVLLKLASTAALQCEVGYVFIPATADKVMRPRLPAR